MKRPSRRVTLAGYLDQLFDSEKHKTRRREEALQGIVQELTRNLTRDESFLDSNRMSLMDQCLRVIKKARSAEELATAARAIGLVAMILDDAEAAHEIYLDSAFKLSEAVKLSSSKLKLPTQVLQCFAVVTFFGAFLSEERLDSMEMIWGYYFQEDSAHQGKEGNSPELIAAAISSWTFILSNCDYGVNRTYSQTKIPCLINLMENGNESVVVAAAEALALIFEIDHLSNSCRMLAENCNDGDGAESSNEFKKSIAKKLEEIMRATKTMDSEEEGKEQDQTTGTTRLALLANYFEEGKFQSIKKQGMTVTTWLQRIQLTFLEEFLGKERCREHIKVNKQLQSMFKIKSAKKSAVERPVVACHAEREEVKLRFFQPKQDWIPDEEGEESSSSSSSQRRIQKRLAKSSSNSVWNKAKTQHMKQQRKVADADRGKNMSQDYDY
ncbi:hypothetical protein LINGRAHAP2_LOCUS8253 [Linum grandiflorum]